MSFINLMVKINERQMDLWSLVTGLGKQRIILGFPWLNKNNLDINWQTGKNSWHNEETKQQFLNIRYKGSPSHPLALARKLAQEALGPKKTPRSLITEEVDKEERKNQTTNPMIGNREVLVKEINETD